MKIKCSKKQKYTNDNISLKLNNWVDFRFCSFNLILLDFFFFCFLIFLLLCFVLKFFTNEKIIKFWWHKFHKYLINYYELIIPP